MTIPVAKSGTSGIIIIVVKLTTNPLDSILSPQLPPVVLIASRPPLPLLALMGCASCCMAMKMLMCFIQRWLHSRVGGGDLWLVPVGCRCLPANFLKHFVYFVVNEAVPE